MVSTLRFEAVSDDATVSDWQRVHNEIIPVGVLSLDEVRERAGHYHLEVVYLGDVLVGCSTVRPPTPESSVAVLIVRVLPDHRGQGIGGQMLARGLARARELSPSAIETIVWEANEAGLRFALAHGFVETDRWLPSGDSVPFITLTLISTGG